MELRQLWKIVRRRWWLIVLPALIAALYATYTYIRSPIPSYYKYITVIRLTAATPAPERVMGFEDSRYFPWVVSEYIVHGLRDWILTRSFREEISAGLAAEGIDIPAAQMNGIFYADNVGSILTLYISWNDPAQLEAITRAAIQTIERSGDYFPQIQGLKVVPFDQPAIEPTAPPEKDRLDPIIRAGLGLVAGIALAFLVEYLDSSLHERADVEALGLPVLAEIPMRGSGRR